MSLLAFVLDASLRSELAKAEEALVADLSTSAEVAERLLQNGCQGSRPLIAGWAHDCPLAIWFSRALLNAGVITAQQRVGFDGRSITVRKEGAVSPLLACWALNALLCQFATEYDEESYPELFRESS